MREEIGINWPEEVQAGREKQLSRLRSREGPHQHPRGASGARDRLASLILWIRLHEVVIAAAEYWAW